MGFFNPILSLLYFLRIVQNVGTILRRRRRNTTVEPVVAVIVIRVLNTGYLYRTEAGVTHLFVFAMIVSPNLDKQINRVCRKIPSISGNRNFEFSSSYMLKMLYATSGKKNRRRKRIFRFLGILSNNFYILFKGMQRFSFLHAFFVCMHLSKT